MAQIAAAAAIIKDGEGRLLLVRRGPAAREQPGFWENLGEGLENGEAPDAALVRKAKAVLGTDLQLGPVLLEYEAFTDQSGQPWTIVIYEGTLSGQPTTPEQEKYSELRWVTKADLADLPLTSYTRTDFAQLGWL
jgi:ADP-ribose pyrophosphatase YjhB (NUDIX family)